MPQPVDPLSVTEILIIAGSATGTLFLMGLCLYQALKPTPDSAPNPRGN